jgi:hypothetical protein
MWSGTPNPSGADEFTRANKNFIICSQVTGLIFSIIKIKILPIKKMLYKLAVH